MVQQLTNDQWATASGWLIAFVAVQVVALLGVTFVALVVACDTRAEDLEKRIWWVLITGGALLGAFVLLDLVYWSAMTGRLLR